MRVCLVLCAVLVGDAFCEPPRVVLEPLIGRSVSGKIVTPLNSPFGVDFDRRGNMIIVELEGGRVWRKEFLNNKPRSSAPMIISGNGWRGYEGDGGDARNAVFNGMHNVAVLPNSDILIADSWNHAVRRIDGKTGQIHTIAGTGKAGFSGDGGSARKATFNYVMCISLTPNNKTLLIADLKNRRVRAVDLQSGVVRTIAGNGKRGVPKDGSVAANSPLVDPRAVIGDSAGNTYILERGGHCVRVVDRAGRIRTIIGTGKRGKTDGPARSAQLNSPKHLCRDAKGRIVIADEGNHSIRLYDPKSGRVTTLVKRGLLSKPHGVCYEKGYLYIVDTGNGRIFRTRWD